jgi:hypothetical protein
LACLLTTLQLLRCCPKRRGFYTRQRRLSSLFTLPVFPASGEKLPTPPFELTCDFSPPARRSASASRCGFLVGWASRMFRCYRSNSHWIAYCIGSFILPLPTSLSRVFSKLILPDFLHSLSGFHPATAFRLPCASTYFLVSDLLFQRDRFCFSQRAGLYREWLSCQEISSNLFFPFSRMGECPPRP